MRKILIYTYTIYIVFYFLYFLSVSWWLKKECIIITVCEKKDTFKKIKKI